MNDWEPFRQCTSYCKYGALFRKNTSIWTNIGVRLRPTCTRTDPCSELSREGRHLFTAQSGAHGTQIGMGPAQNVEGYPTGLVHDLLGGVWGDTCFNHSGIPEFEFPLHVMTRSRRTAPVEEIHQETAEGEIISPELEEQLHAPDGDFSSDTDSDLEGNAREAYRHERRRWGTTVFSAPQGDLQRELRAAYGKDVVYQTLVKQRQEGAEVSEDSNIQATLERYRLDGHLVRRRDDGRIYIPSSPILIDHLVEAVHGVGHFGLDKCMRLLTKVAYWPTMGKDVATRIGGCLACARFKVIRARRHGELQPLPIPEFPWESISVDWITGLPPVAKRLGPRTMVTSKNVYIWQEQAKVSALYGHKDVVDSIFVITDRLSKGVKLRAVSKSTDHADVLECLAEEVFRHFGWPKDIASDNDVRFLPEYRAYLRAQGVDLHFTSAYHPQAYGQAERSNSTVMNVLRTLCNGMPWSWPSVLPHVEFAINATPAGHGETPFSLFLSHPPRNPVEMALTGPKPYRSSEVFYQTLVKRRQEGTEVSEDSDIQATLERYRLDGHLVRRRDDGRIYIPSSPILIDHLVEAVHGVGHFGLDKCMRLPSKVAYWTTMDKDVVPQSEVCMTCARFNPDDGHLEENIREGPHLNRRSTMWTALALGMGGSIGV